MSIVAELNRNENNTNNNNNNNNNNSSNILPWHGLHLRATTSDVGKTDDRCAHATATEQSYRVEVTGGRKKKKALAHTSSSHNNYRPGRTTMEYR
jgi:hypothetical protein